MPRKSEVAKWILIGAGVLFTVNGVIVLSLIWAGVIPAGFTRVGGIFLTLGIVGSPVAWFGLRSVRIWPLAILSLAFVPWTLIGLLADTRQGYWLLVAGEAIGLVLILWALGVKLREATALRSETGD